MERTVLFKFTYCSPKIVCSINSPSVQKMNSDIAWRQFRIANVMNYTLMCCRNGDAFLGQVCNCTEVQSNDGNDIGDMSNKLNETAIIRVGVFISGKVKNILSAGRAKQNVYIKSKNT